MNCAYWDAVADNYEDSVLSVFDHDAEGRVRARISEAADPTARAADLGCGVGKFTELLAGAFGFVEACDVSSRSLEKARQRCQNHANITYHQLDFALDAASFAPVDFVLCVNVLIMPDLDARMRAWRMVTNQVAHGGRLVLVVPALESTLLGDFRVLDHALRQGLSCEEALRAGGSPEGNLADLHLGVRPLDGLRTKHYLREELEWMVDDHGFAGIEMEKIEYAWEVMLPDTPLGAKGPYMWDWLVSAVRR